MSLRVFVAVLVMAVFCSAPPALRAQVLSDQVPGDALLYVSWRGPTPVAGQDASRALGVLDAADGARVVRALADELGGGGQDPSSGPPELKWLLNMGAETWRYPWAFYVQYQNPRTADDAPLRAALVFEAKGSAQVLLERLRTEMPENCTAKINHHDDLIALTWGFHEADAASVGAAPPSPLSALAGFQRAAAHAAKDPQAMVYINAEAIVARIGNLPGITTQDRQGWDRTRAALGLDGLKGIIWTGIFAGKDWATDLFIDAPAPRAGLLRCLDARGVSEETLKLIPKTASWCSAMRLDASALLGQLRGAMGEMDAQHLAATDQALREQAAALGVDLVGDIVPALGPEWAIYADPAIPTLPGAGAGPGPLPGALPGGVETNFVVVNKLQNPERMETSLSILERRIGDAIGDWMPPGVDGQFHIFNQRGVKVHAMNTPGLSPAWAVQDGKLYFALSPDAVVFAARDRQERTDSILDNPQFAKLRGRLGGGQVSQIAFADLVQTAPPAHAGWSAAVNAAARAAQELSEDEQEAADAENGAGNNAGTGGAGGTGATGGGEGGDAAGKANGSNNAANANKENDAHEANEDAGAPAATREINASLPALAGFLPHLGPACWIGWSDQAGYHRAGLQPFPGSGFFNPTGSVLSEPAVVGLVTLMPWIDVAAQPLSLHRHVASNR